jgi:hypothetical protein
VITSVAGVPTTQAPNRNFRINSAEWESSIFFDPEYQFMVVSVTNLNRDTATEVSFQIICRGYSGVYSFQGPTFPGALASGATNTLSLISSKTYDPPCPSYTVTIDATSAPNAMTLPSAPTKPSVTGKAIATTKGTNKLTAKKGSWTGDPTPVIGYQWYSCSYQVKSVTQAIPKSCKKILKATKSTLAVTNSLKGKCIAVAVTGKGTGTIATTWLSKSTAKVK